MSTWQSPDAYLGPHVSDQYRVRISLSFLRRLTEYVPLPAGRSCLPKLEFRTPLFISEATMSSPSASQERSNGTTTLDRY